MYLHIYVYKKNTSELAMYYAGIHATLIISRHVCTCNVCACAHMYAQTSLNIHPEHVQLASYHAGIHATLTFSLVLLEISCSCLQRNLAHISRRLERPLELIGDGHVADVVIESSGKDTVSTLICSHALHVCVCVCVCIHTYIHRTCDIVSTLICPHALHVCVCVCVCVYAYIHTYIEHAI